MRLLVCVLSLLAVLKCRRCMQVVDPQFNTNSGPTLSNCKNTLVAPHDCDKERISPFRTLDGRCNNLKKPLQGSAFQPLFRLLPPKYEDGSDKPIGFPGVGSSFPTPNEVSQKVFTVIEDDSSDLGPVSNYHMTFGQFLDHDLSLSNNPGACENPKCEPGNLIDFEYPCLPIKFSSDLQTPGCSKFTRTFPVCNMSPREQINVLTAYIDGSQIYGSSEELSKRLRTNDGSGRLVVGSKDLLPNDPTNFKDPCQDKQDRGGCFLAGDGRVNEHIGLVALHTIFVRQHNKIADELKKLNPHWGGENLFQTTRKIIGGILQHISYEEYVPTMVDLKPYSLNPKKQYNENVSVNIANSFSTAAFRYGHSQIKNSWAQLDMGFNKCREDLSLQETFFNNRLFVDNTDGVETTIMGLCGNHSDEVDLNFASGAADKLFISMKDKGHQNLIAINIQRGRDHGLQSYTEYRKKCGFGAVQSFDDLKIDIPNQNVRDALHEVYGDVDKIDLFVGGIAEKHLKGKVVGPTFGCIIKDQFERSRDGDRYFYKRKGVFTRRQLREIEKVSMARVLCDTLHGIISVQENVLSVSDPKKKKPMCQLMPIIDLSIWKEPRRSGSIKQNCSRKH